ncbi:ATP-binding cassette domain-containing protein [Georgenia sp. TF02-10]|uniref:amino acid ABC transporter ATP-binding/permease protein n=1 Tax=Georgenia sp. TF02-10 TaxID=2917725 RepID=UPI001FA7F84C|nr:ATP-binding cassette domain-containing protein [Georgenia sp. TF02-10]UNX53834.1 ATP-binding cassette domain-containing protein [Georgenia sp. TF02-10]
MTAPLAPAPAAGGTGPGPATPRPAPAPDTEPRPKRRWARGLLPTAERHALRRAVALLDLDRLRLLWAVLAGSAGLASAVGLTATSAWLIARASQMPPVLELSVAAVAVRTFGISRALLRYLERLASHDLALRGMAALRERLYLILAAGRADAVAGLRRGDLLARTGADVDAVGDVVVRAVLPAAVAAVVGVGTVGLVTWLHPAAGAVLAACLLLAGVVGPWLSMRSARLAEQARLTARGEVAATAMTILDGAAELTVAGRVPQVLGHLRRAEGDLARAKDRAARPAALAAGVDTLAMGLAVLGALVLGVPATTAGALSPVELAVIVLTPLAAFEGTAMLGPAATQLVRSAAAARRIMDLLDAAGGSAAASAAPADGGPAPVAISPADGGLAPGTPTDGGPAPVAVSPADGRPAPGTPTDGGSTPRAVPADDGDGGGRGVAGGPHLAARGLAVGWPGGPTVAHGIDLDLVPGRAVAVVGPSGIGKTTLLLTLAGLLPPRAGTVGVDGVPLEAAGPVAGGAVVLTAEDAHVFGTTVLENLRVARGDVSAAEGEALLRRVGLGAWLAGLPAGLDTLLGPDGATISGGERRRLLLARALASPAPLLLLDEPAEHLDPATADHLVADLLRAGPDVGTLLVTHRLSALAAADEVILLGRGDGDGADAGGATVLARGTHAELLATVPVYRWAAEQEAR